MSIGVKSFKMFVGAAILAVLALFGCDRISGLLGGGDAFAFVPTKEGMALTTIHRDGDGKISGATRTIVKSVNRSGKNMTITTVSQIFDKKGEVTNTLEEITNVVDGVTEINLASGLAEMLGLPGSTISGSGILRLPSNMKAGELFGNIRLEVGGINVSITDIRCDAVEEITVPAGKFSNAYKMTYNININRARSGWQEEINISMPYTTWAVKGIGIVKSRIVSNNGVMGTSELIGLERDGEPSDNRLVIEAIYLSANSVMLRSQQL